MKRMMMYAAVFLTAFAAADVCQADLIIQSQVVDVVEGSSGPVTFDIQVQAVGAAYDVIGFNLPTIITSPTVATFESFDANPVFGNESTTPFGAPFTASVGFGASNGSISVADGGFFSLGTFTLNTSNVLAGTTEVASFASTGFDGNFFQIETVSSGIGTPVVNSGTYSLQATAIPEPSSLALVAFAAVASVGRRRRSR